MTLEKQGHNYSGGWIHWDSKKRVTTLECEPVSQLHHSYFLIKYKTRFPCFHVFYELSRISTWGMHTTTSPMSGIPRPIPRYQNDRWKENAKSQKRRSEGGRPRCGVGKRARGPGRALASTSRCPKPSRKQEAQAGSSSRGNETIPGKAKTGKGGVGGERKAGGARTQHRRQATA